MFEETLEERTISGRAASPGGPAVKALGAGYRGQCADMMLREGVGTCGKKPIRLERQRQDIQYRDEGTGPRR